MLSFKEFIAHLKYPQPPNERGDGLNTLIDKDYKPYPTAKNIPASLKGKADQSQKSEELPGYKGDVLKSNTAVREGKGIQYHANGTVFDGYFQTDQFIKGRMIDSEGNQVTGTFVE